MLKNKVIYFVLAVISPLIIFINFNINPKVLYSDLVEIFTIILSVISGFISYLFAIKNKKVLSRLLLVFNVVLCLIISGWTLFSKYEMLQVFSSIASFKQFILSTGQKGMFIYVLVQIIQVLFVPIPAMIITLTGVAIYGPFLGATLCSLGVLIGSYGSFLIGRVFGSKLVIWIAGEQNAKKYADLINNRGKFFLIIAFLLPLFPDDILCLIAGITNMKFNHFFWIALITRPIGVFCMGFFGGGYIIPFTGWGLFVWPFILIFAIGVIIVLTKFQPQIESWILTKLSKLNLKKKKAVK